MLVYALEEILDTAVAVIKVSHDDIVSVKDTKPFDDIEQKVTHQDADVIVDVHLALQLHEQAININAMENYSSLDIHSTPEKLSFSINDLYQIPSHLLDVACKSFFIVNDFLKDNGLFIKLLPVAEAGAAAARASMPSYASSNSGSAGGRASSGGFSSGYRAPGRAANNNFPAAANRNVPGGNNLGNNIGAASSHPAAPPQQQTYNNFRGGSTGSSIPYSSSSLPQWSTSRTPYTPPGSSNTYVHSNYGYTPPPIGGSNPFDLSGNPLEYPKLSSYSSSFSNSGFSSGGLGSSYNGFNSNIGGSNSFQTGSPNIFDSGPSFYSPPSFDNSYMFPHHDFIYSEPVFNHPQPPQPDTRSKPPEPQPYSKTGLFPVYYVDTWGTAFPRLEKDIYVYYINTVGVIFDSLGGKRDEIAYFPEDPEISSINAQIRAYDVEYISQALAYLFKAANIFEIPIDEDYLYNILSLPIPLVAQVLQNELIIEVLAQKAEMPINWEYSCTKDDKKYEPGSAAGGSGGGGNSTDPGGGEGQFSMLPGVKEALIYALHRWGVDIIIRILKDSGWILSKDALNKVPNHIREGDVGMAKKGVGLRFDYKIGDSSKDYIRVMRGNPNSDFPSQHRDYVKIVSNGKVLGRDGNVISQKEHRFPSEHPDAHIRLEEWLNWRSWNGK